MSAYEHFFYYSYCKMQKRSGTQGIIEIQNPNLVKAKNLKAKDVDVSYLVMKIFVCQSVVRVYICWHGASYSVIALSVASSPVDCWYIL